MAKVRRASPKSKRKNPAPSSTSKGRNSSKRAPVTRRTTPERSSSQRTTDDKLHALAVARRFEAWSRRLPIAELARRVGRAASTVAGWFRKADRLEPPSEGATRSMEVALSRHEAAKKAAATRKRNKRKALVEHLKKPLEKFRAERQKIQLHGGRRGDDTIERLYQDWRKGKDEVLHVVKNYGEWEAIMEEAYEGDGGDDYYELQGFIES